MTRACPKCKKGKWDCQCGFVGTTAALIGGISAATSIGTAAYGASKAKKAGRVQAAGSERAAELIKEHRDEALKFNRQVYEQQQQNLQPYTRLGGAGVANLGYLMGVDRGIQAPPPAQRPPGAGIPNISPEEIMQARRRGPAISELMQRRV